MAEAIDSAAAVGIPAERTACLDFSEVEIYRRMMYVTLNHRSATWLKPFFQTIYDRIREYVFDYKPQAVFTCAYQGGNPEHDLTHYFTRLAVDDYERDSGRSCRSHVPMYEYTVLVALRFNPFYRGLRWRYHLTTWRRPTRCASSRPTRRSWRCSKNSERSSKAWLPGLSPGQAADRRRIPVGRGMGARCPRIGLLGQSAQARRRQLHRRSLQSRAGHFAKSVRPIDAAFPRRNKNLSASTTSIH
jgi:hypothetical protein